MTLEKQMEESLYIKPHSHNQLIPHLKISESLSYQTNTSSQNFSSQTDLLTLKACNSVKCVVSSKTLETELTSCSQALACNRHMNLKPWCT